MRAALWIACAAAALAACGDTTNTGVSQLNLDRPIDISFACYGGLRLTNGGSADITQMVTDSAQPTTSCDFRSAPRGATDPAPIPTGQEDLSKQGGTVLAGVAWYGFVLQSEPGTVAIARFDTKPSTSFIGGDVSVIDADPLTPGNNGISVGEDPIAIATDKVGCFEMTANAGSCDLSALDIGSALDANVGAKVDRLQVMSSTGAPVRSRPAAMVAEPPAGTIGVACPATPTGLMYVAYPSCHAVAGIDVSTGTVVTSIRFDAAGVASIGDGNLVCPDECSGGASPAAGTRPVTIDLREDPRVHTRRMAIGADNSPVFTIVEIGADSLPASLTQIPLEDKHGTLGLTHVTISPQIGMGGASGLVDDSVGSQSQFVYGVATDSTIRVADILNVGKECDAQVDPRLIRDQKSVKTLSCMPVGDPTTPARRPGARGPGVELVGQAIPTSITIVKADNFDSDTRDVSPSTLKGYFGVITSANGATFIMNVDDDNYGDTVVNAEPFHTQIPLAIAHQLRDGIPDRDLLATANDSTGAPQPICDTDGPNPDATAGNDGPARAAASPIRANTSGFVAADKVGELPSIRQVLCTGTDDTKPVSELSFAAPQTVRDLVWPDLRGLRVDETWTLTWEGSLSQDTQDSANDGPAIREGQLEVTASDGMSLIDQTHPFCNAGVQPDDIVQLRGCDPAAGDSDCPLGYTCFVHPDSQVTGLGACMLTDEASRLADACKEFLVSLRRYTVARAETGELVLIPRRHVLRTSPVDGCVSDDQCKALADYTVRETSSADPSADMTPADTHTWSCQADPTRAPVAGTGNRCVETCTKDSECDSGAVCQNNVCFDSVIPPQACVNSPQRFDLRASDAFTVIGSTSGFVHPIIADSGGTCVHDPAASPFQVGRIPLAPPACDPAADERTGLKADGTYDANPCSVVVDESELDPVFLAGSCNLANPATVLASRKADAVRFHNRGMTLTLVDPTYPGDDACIGDRGGKLGKVPFVFSNYQLAFRQTAGFAPLSLSINPAFPVRVVRGPTESIWVIDDGDFLSTDISVPSTRGKVFRIEPQNLNVVNLVE